MNGQFLIFSICVFSSLVSAADEKLVALEYSEIDGDVTRGWFASPEAIQKASDATNTFQEILGGAKRFLEEDVKQIWTGPLDETFREVDSWSFTGARVIPITLDRTRKNPSEWPLSGAAGFFYLLTFWALDEDGSSIDILKIGVLADRTIIKLEELPSTKAEMEWNRYTRAEIKGHQQDEALKP